MIFGSSTHAKLARSQRGFCSKACRTIRPSGARGHATSASESVCTFYEFARLPSRNVGRTEYSGVSKFRLQIVYNCLFLQARDFFARRTWKQIAPTDAFCQFNDTLTWRWQGGIPAFCYLGLSIFYYIEVSNVSSFRFNAKACSLCMVSEIHSPRSKPLVSACPWRWCSAASTGQVC